MRNVIILLLVMLPFMGGLYSGCTAKKRAARSAQPKSEVTDTLSSKKELEEKATALEEKEIEYDEKIVDEAEVEIESEAEVEPEKTDVVDSDKKEPHKDSTKLPLQDEIPFDDEVVADAKILPDSIKSSKVTDSLKVVSADKPKDKKEVAAVAPKSTGKTAETVSASGAVKGKTKKEDDERKVVDFEADIMRPIKVGDSSALNLLGNVVLYHNGAVITCDSAVRYSERRMECFNRVIINQNTTYIYGDRADYNGELNEARVYAPIIKIVDEDAIMYTYNFSFNTLDKIGRYSGGATLSQKDNHMESQRGYYYVDEREFIGVDEVEVRNPDYEMQSDSAMYNLNTEVASFFVRSYIWNNKGEILSAEQGNYNHPTHEYSFSKNAYIVTENQEIWADTLDYNSETENAIMRSNVQLRDDDQKVMGFGDYGQYWGDEKKGLLTRNPSLLSFDPEEPDTLYIRADSMFLYTFSRDTVFVTTVTDEAYEQGVSQIFEEEMILPPDTSAIITPEGVVDDVKGEELDEDAKPYLTTEGVELPNSSAMRPDSLSGFESLEKARDSLGQREIRVPDEQGFETDLDDDGVVSEAVEPKVIEKSKAELEAEQREARRAEKEAAREAKRVAKETKRAAKAKKRGKTEEITTESADSTEVALDDSQQMNLLDLLRSVELPDSVEIDFGQLEGLDSLDLVVAVRELTDSLGIELPILRDSVESDDTILLDSLGNEIVPDSLLGLEPMEPAGEKDTIQRVVFGYNNVRIYREDFQAVCDSLVGFSIDSTMHLYIEPVLWNGQNQITSEIIDIYSKGEEIDRAIFRGEPFMSAEVDTNMYNQIKGKLMKAYFRDNDIYRNDVIGNGQTYYYMEDDKTKDLMGFLVAECADITFLIENRQMDKIIYRLDPVYSIYPMDKIPATQEQFLPGFKWAADRRPKTKEDVFDRQIRPSEREEYMSREKPQFPLTDAILKDKERMIKERIWRERNDTLSPEALEFIRTIEREQEQAKALKSTDY